MSAKSLIGALLLGFGAGAVNAQVSGAPERAEESQPGTVAVGPMLEYSSGEFGGTESTEIWSIGVTGRYERGRWIVRATVPYVAVSGPGNVVPTGGGGGTPVCRQAGAGPGTSRGGIRCPSGGSTATAAGRFSSSGLGDVTVGLTFRLLDRASTAFDFTGKVKIPTADENKALGTGEFDYSMQGDLLHTIGKAGIFATAGYRWYGDPPGVELKDVFFGALGATYQVAPQATVGLAYDYRQRTYDGGAALNELSLFASYKATSSFRVRGYVFKGLSDGGPDWGAGVLALFAF